MVLDDVQTFRLARKMFDSTNKSCMARLVLAVVRCVKPRRPNSFVAFRMTKIEFVLNKRETA